MNIKERSNYKFIPKSLISIQKMFLSCESIPLHCLQQLLKDISWDDQENLIKLTVLHPLVLKYPVKKVYQRQFLKNIISTIENQNLDVYDEFYNIFCKLNINENDEKMSYKHFILDINDFKKIITIKESISFVSEGTTGLCSWEASQALTEYLVNNSNLVTNKSILELGAGVGLTALFLWSICTPRKYNITDCHPSVLRLLCENVSVNFNNERDEYLDFPDHEICNESSLREVNTKFTKSMKNAKGQELNVVDLSWENTELLKEFIDIDLILAADVVYDLSIIPCLCNCLKLLLMNNLQNKCTAFVACTVRNQDTILKFTTEIENLQLEITKVDSFTLERNGSKYKTPVDIYKICLKV